jgi:hypothetical protein
VNHSPIEDARACIRLWKVFSREIGIYPVKMAWNCFFGSKEARFDDPPDFKDVNQIVGPYTGLLRADYK